jgi:GNAT superfamily N-acetyltransferase
VTRALRPDDAAAAIALSDEAGWNQTVADWRFMLAAGEARGQLTPAGALVASALILPYDDRVAWIGMVLTTESHRQRGLATENLRWALDRCAERDLIAGLDATPAGREVYAPLGFTDLWGLQRLRAERPVLSEPAHQTVIRPMQDDDLAAVAALDGEAFGVGRAPLMAYLRVSLPGCAWVAERERSGDLAGFVLGRPGQLTTHIGPLIAHDPEAAAALVGRAIAQLALAGSGPEPAPASSVSIDVPDGQRAFRDRLLAAGFAPVRPFTRMLRRKRTAFGRAGLMFAIAGPELG